MQKKFTVDLYVPVSIRYTVEANTEDEAEALVLAKRDGLAALSYVDIPDVSFSTPYLAKPRVYVQYEDVEITNTLFSH